MLLLKDECALCKRLFKSSMLRRCVRCGKLYCFDCTTFTEDGYIICLNCARRQVSPRKFGTKYSPLSRYLLHRGQFTDHVTLSFAEIEGIIGDNLPFGAIRDAEWWSNNRSGAQGKAWMDVGWKMQSVDMTQRTVTFVRVAEMPPQAEKKGKKKAAATKWAKPTVTFPRKKRMLPSKTRIAKAQARLRNVERERAAIQQFQGKFKPKPAFEKRLYKSAVKPSEVDK